MSIHVMTHSDIEPGTPPAATRIPVTPDSIEDLWRRHQAIRTRRRVPLPRERPIVVIDDEVTPEHLSYACPFAAGWIVELPLTHAYIERATKRGRE